MQIKLYSGGAFALATVCNPDGTFNRQYKITNQEYAALSAGAGDIVPPGMTPAEWHNPGSQVTGGHLDVGELLVEPDGYAFLKYDEKVDAQGQFVEYGLKFAPGEYTGNPPSITVLPGILSAVRDARGAPIRPPVVDITAGILTAAVVVPQVP